MAQTQDTIAALATPTGTAALAVLRISGTDTGRLARELCGEPPLPRVVRRADYCDRAGGLVDDVLVTFFQGPASYTGEDVLEISCHGNPFIAQRILEDLLARGCRVAAPGEFTQRAFLHGRMDLSQAEAVMDLIHARSERALVAANQQLRGALGRHMAVLVDGLLGVLARIEAYIDFPEEDLPVEDRALVQAEIARLLLETGRLLATNRYGDVLREGLKTVIIGEPNAGKSMLLNRLLGRERALVSPEPGTTRDYLEERIIIGPHSLRLIDTAGLNPSPAPLEQRGITLSLERAREADLIVLVFDASRPAPVFPAEILQGLTPERTLVVANKADLPTLTENYNHFKQFELVTISALTGEGIERLREALVHRAEVLQVSVGSELIAINARHAEALERAKHSLADAQTKLATNGASELIASDLRDAMAAYGEIAGKIDNERMLDQLFASFCIGK